MTLEKRIIEVADYTAPGEEPIINKKEIFVEIKTITEEVIRHKDMIESMISQKQNNIDNLKKEIEGLKSKMKEIDNLSS